MTVQHAQQFLKRRKFLLFLPVLVIPFLTLFFWAIGGGKGAAATTTVSKSQGLNIALPSAQNDSSLQNKLTLYQQALKDSMSLQQERQEDPYSRESLVQPDSTELDYPGYGYSNPSNILADATDPNEEKVNRKLEAFKAALAKQPQMESSDMDDYHRYEAANASAALDRAQSAMQQAQNMGGTSGGDPDLEKMDGMLQKILDIQHPQEAKDRMEALSQAHKGQVFSVNLSRKSNVADLLAVNDSRQHSPDASAGTGAFYESSSVSGKQPQDNTAVTAVVNETQTLVSGATIKMRLTEDIYVNGVRIPKGNFVYATCSLDGERLKGDIATIRYTDKLFPVSLAIYDLDGIEGIKVPGAISRDAAKQGMQQGLQAMDLYSMDQSLGAQAASAGIQTAKSLFGNKVKLVRATVRSDYPVLLMDKKKQNN